MNFIVANLSITAAAAVSLEILFFVVAAIGIWWITWKTRPCHHPDLHTHFWSSDDGTPIVLTHCPDCGYFNVGHYREVEIV